MMMNPNFQQVMMKPTKPERSRFIISSFFVLFLCAVVSIYEVRSGNLLKFGSHIFFSYNSSSSASFLPLNSTSNDIRIFIGILTLPDQYQRRHFLRIIYGTQSPAGAKVDVKFVFWQPHEGRPESLGCAGDNAVRRHNHPQLHGEHEPGQDVYVLLELAGDAEFHQGAISAVPLRNEGG
ncbi:hypothetical protein CK203_051966 [Vitis vinifera]|uniref:Uncharacterized protein n=1 Tax=Vitis vinifera TaxID=29760 RepID=A0A438GTI4_VITVI|nr:hypothetical protein CK203_051966 [Vitis vinifera]